MAYPSAPDPEARQRKVGRIWGVCSAIVATTFGYWLVAALPFGFDTGYALEQIVMIAPLVVGAVLTGFKRTRALATGLFFGALFTYIVSIPTCIAVFVATVGVGG